MRKVHTTICILQNITHFLSFSTTQYEPHTLARIFLGSQIVAPGVGVSNSDSSFSWLERFPEKVSDGCEEDANEPESLDKWSGYVKRAIQEPIKSECKRGWTWQNIMTLLVAHTFVSVHLPSLCSMARKKVCFHSWSDSSQGCDV